MATCRVVSRRKRFDEVLALPLKIVGRTRFSHTDPALKPSTTPWIALPQQHRSVSSSACPTCEPCATVIHRMELVHKANNGLASVSVARTPKVTDRRVTLPHTKGRTRMQRLRCCPFRIVTTRSVKHLSRPFLR